MKDALSGMNTDKGEKIFAKEIGLSGRRIFKVCLKVKNNSFKIDNGMSFSRRSGLIIPTLHSRTENFMKLLQEILAIILLVE